jgi:putative SOS response-associated peptidase YedK
VILRRDAEDVWLDPGITDPDLLRDCLISCPAGAMVGYPVSTRGSHPGTNTPDLITPLG